MNSTKHLIDEIKNILDHLPELMKEPITADNLIEKREAYGLIAAEMAREQPAIEGIETFELSSSNSQDNFKVPFFFHRPTQRQFFLLNRLDHFLTFQYPHMQFLGDGKRRPVKQTSKFQKQTIKLRTEK